MRSIYRELQQVIKINQVNVLYNPNKLELPISIRKYRVYFIMQFRVGSSQKREESVYEALTKLPDRDDGINAFKILGEKVMLLMMNGSAYFLNNNR